MELFMLIMLAIAQQQHVALELLTYRIILWQTEILSDSLAYNLLQQMHFFMLMESSVRPDQTATTRPECLPLIPVRIPS